MSNNDIKVYYSIMGKKAVITNNPFSIVIHAFDRKTIILSDKRITRGIARAFRLERESYREGKKQAEIYFALIDALQILNKKNIPVYYVNRVGLMKNGFAYSRNATIRMNEHNSFPKMSENYEKYKLDFEELVGEKCSEEYVKKISEIPQIVQKMNTFCHEDIASEYINIVDGKRITIGNNNSKHRLHIYGRCGVFGYAVEDHENFPNQLQKIINEKGEFKYSIINHGLWGGSDKEIFHNFFFDLATFRNEDVVLFYLKHLNPRLIVELEKYGLIYMDITNEWHEYPEARHCFYDRPGHMNAIGYKHVAEIIYKRISNCGFEKKAVPNELLKFADGKHINQFLKNNGNVDFEREVSKYTESILTQFPIAEVHKSIGSIVMNCNPFTKGHRYLIEYAARKVDRLFIFVVEEDKSAFKFTDRFEMVKRGTEDIKNVVVVPSGKLIISTITFPEYFLKDYVKEKDFDVSGDLETFCKYIAPALHITKRFAGEEPFDPVTEKYNESMKHILPQYGISFIEVPRKKTDDMNEIINATKVRRLIRENRFNELSRYLPETTIQIIKEKYVGDGVF